jgi:acyl transferase domain-containing protein/NADPH:quinone reductase-like Zn-dependent oxidoreductase/thioesterase domain-containing protein/NAD(P)-dependent dehydrogenase (short-subunit alcohol dehydrogenase family)/acyl carrier protein/ubiquinone/menaquinone biosynthesis C-methylase UbiE
MEEISHEPIAIIGMGCRLPGGVTDLDSYWHVLEQGVDAITEIPADRWRVDAFYDAAPGTTGKTNARWGGFLDGIDQFEPACFHISPREAVNMDPQQRLLLEVTWEALEDAGLPVDRLAGSRTGVFVGVSMSDYGSLQGTPTNLRTFNSMTSSGTGLSIASNRISYCFDLRGPSTSVDTACSSSLVAVDCAVRNIRDGQCEMAIVGGVNLILSPQPFVSFSAASMLSPDGRCKAFDARANGFVRAEGAGVIILKPLSQAQADGDAVHAVILGATLNQDGRTSGISMPNSEAQAAMLRELYAELGVHPANVGYVEAHGTGTVVGDPAEAYALGRILGADRPASQPLRIGSVKTNIGHLEAASGMASIIKATLILKHRKIPPSLHFNEPNPNIPFEDLHLQVVTEALDWPNNTDPAIIGVNSFGFGGTNGHVVLRAHESETEPLSVSTELCGGTERLLTLSARSPETLDSVVSSIDNLLSGNGSQQVALDDVCHSLQERKTHLAHRIALVVRSREDALEQLRKVLAQESVEGMHAGEQARELPGLAFVFSGQGPQWWGMGQDLLKTECVFRDALEECDALVRRFGDWGLLEELAATESESRIQETAFAQPAIFAVQVGLARLWESWGIVPDAVVGHSVGEVAAAHVCGALSLSDAVRVIVHRGRCMAKLPATGRMLAVALPAPEAEAAIARKGNGVAVAAVNGPNLVTLSGNASDLEALAGQFKADEVFHKFLRVRHAFHSKAMDPVQDEFVAGLSDLHPRTPTRTMVSTVTGTVVEDSAFTADYWWNNIRQQVRFVDAISQLSEDGHELFVEIAPHPVLSAPVVQCCRESARPATALPSLRREEPERAVMLESLGALYTAGRPINWAGLWPSPRPCMRLPHHPWNRESYWIECADNRQARLASEWHPLLGHAGRTAQPTWEGHVDVGLHRYLEDHIVGSSVVFPAAAFVEMALAALQMITGESGCLLEEVHFQKALFLSKDARPILQLSAFPDEATLAFQSSLSGDRGAWSQHCIASWRPPNAAKSPMPMGLETIRRQLPETMSGDECYDSFAALGLRFGPAFRGVRTVWRKDGEALGHIDAPEVLQGESAGYVFHPALMDACFQVVLATVPRDIHAGLMMPSRIGCIRLFGSPTDSIWSHVVLTKANALILEIDIQVYAEDGTPLLTVEGLRFQRVQFSDGRTDTNSASLLYDFHWRSQPLQSGTVRPRAATSLPRTEVLAAEALSQAAYLIADHYPETMAWFERRAPELVWTYVVRALRRLGIPLDRGDTLAVEAVLHDAGILPAYRRLVVRYFRLLERNGFLHATSSDMWKVSKRPPDSDPLPIWCESFTKHPLDIAELRLLELTGPRLAEVLSGQLDPLETLFPGGDFSAAEELYQDAPLFRVENALIQSVISQAVACLPAGRTMRILEVGAGTGGLTAHLLPRLPVHTSEYVFSDISALFVSKAKEKFHTYSNVTYLTFDMDQDPEKQGLLHGAFDIIVASNVLHAVRDLRVTLGNLHDLLATNGMLVINELQQEHPCLDVEWGLTEGWWRFEDYDLRPDYPLLTRDAWENLLQEVGYNDVTALSPTKTGSELLHTVLLANVGATAPLERATVPALCNAQDTAEGEPLTETEPRHWLIFADNKGVGIRLADRLVAMGDLCTIAHAGSAFARADATNYHLSPHNPQDMNCLLDALGDTSIFCVVHLWSLNATSSDALTSGSLEEAAALGCHSAMHLAQALQSGERRPSGPLALVTAGAQDFGLAPGHLAIAQSSLLGLGRVLRNEYYQQQVKLVDLGPALTDSDVEDLLLELHDADAEHEVVWRQGSRFVPRLERVPTHVLEPPVARGNGNAPAFRLEITRPGALDSLMFREMERHPPGPGEVEIAVQSAALNFRDIVRALGMFEADEEIFMRLGDECAGTITRLGPGVSELSVGDAVFGCVMGALASHVVIPANFVTPIPVGLSSYEAVTIPVAFQTAYYALIHLGRIQAGESILIHSAAGGVGLAAVQLAQRAGATIYATAGTAEKRSLLAKLGVPDAMDSRSLAFADEVMDRTNGRGVDLVLNSLSGQGLVKSLACLSRNGRFLELGKRDFYQNSKIGLWPFRKNIAFYAIDLAQGFLSQLDLAVEIAKERKKLLEDGSIRPLTGRIFGAARAAEAFRYMAQGKHTGKIILDMRDSNLKIARSGAQALAFDSNATYLITGGFGGFGLELAKLIATRGGRHLVLLSRRGAKSEEAQQALQALQDAGAEVWAPTCDVVDQEQLQAVIAKIDSDWPPLKGVYHTAMVIDDGAMQQLDAQRFQAVMRPKVNGTWNLHACTRELDLDHFVLFSSLSATVGNHGQSNYAAANAFIEAVAGYRRSMGLPATAIGWGALGEVGYMAQREDIAAIAERHGFGRMTPAEAMAALEEALQRDAIRVVAGRLDWELIGATFSRDAEGGTLISNLVKGTGGTSGGSEKGSKLGEMLLRANPEERGPLAEQYIKERIAQVLKTSAEKTDVHARLSELGLDSLMAIELASLLEGDLGITLPLSQLTQDTTGRSLAASLLEQLGGSTGSVPAQQKDLTEKAEHPCAVALTNSGQGTPLFCFHPAGGDLVLYRGLVKALPSDLRVYGIQSRLLAGMDREHATVEAMTKDYADAVEQVHSKGPYHLLGYSLGSRIAMGVAEELAGRGFEVDFLGLVEPVLRPGHNAESQKRLLARFIVATYEFLRAETGVLSLVPITELQQEAEMIADRMLTMGSGGEGHLILNWLEGERRLSGNVLPEVVRDYAKRLETHILLLTADDTLIGTAIPLDVWHACDSLLSKEVLPEAEIRTHGILGGDHYSSMTPPHVSALAQSLATELSRRERPSLAK